MVVREVCKGVYSIGVFDWDRQVFDELLPLPDGTTYNSFLIEGSEKTVLIDTVDPEFEEELITNIARSGVSKIDYIIINHAEQDHSGSIPVFLELFPNAKIITSEKGKELLKSMLQVPDFKISTINDRDTLSLGDKTLEFIQIPWSHWPDSMMTYIREDKMLISMDLFGSHYATSELFIEDVHTHYVNARRYFAEIMMPFRYPTAQNVQTVRELAPEIIAPSHGPIYKGKE
ncbi:MAG: MBL fold metallo-hydrolase, partial [Methanomicrobium sp.]|nr:MBL fold metallo-hydrolase [Methanomicrobium sp.]